MQRDFEIARENLTEPVAASVRRLIVAGDLEEGARINEVRLSQQLGVSRTPLREALNRLAADGIVTARPRIGFSVRSLTIEDFEQVYGVRAVLDPAALAIAGLPPASQLARLEALNATLAKARDPARAVSLDDAWHHTLLAHCTNAYLMQLIDAAMVRTQVYELALMRETGCIEIATNTHARIVAKLRRGKLAEACEALRTNMTEGRAPIVAWLKARVSARTKVKT